MKIRPLLILLLFVTATGIVAWICYATASGRTRSEERERPRDETIAALDACCRRKHVKSIQYDRFAIVAEGEQRRDAARLFRAMALSERLQEYNCAKAIGRLGGSYLPPGRIIVFHGTTAGNLERSLAFERDGRDAAAGRPIDRAMECGNRYAARLLIWASAIDMRRMLLMERCLGDSLRMRTDDAGYLVCPACGNIYDTERCDCYCPHCLTAGAKFIRID